MRWKQPPSGLSAHREGKRSWRNRIGVRWAFEFWRSWCSCWSVRGSEPEPSARINVLSKTLAHARGLFSEPRSSGSARFTEW